MEAGLADLLGTEMLLTEAGAVDAGTARSSEPPQAMWERWALDLALVAEPGARAD